MKRTQYYTLAILMAMSLTYGCSRNSGNTDTGTSTHNILPDVETTVSDSTSHVGLLPLRNPDVQVRTLKGNSLHLATEGLSLAAHGDAVQHSAVYSVTSLAQSELPPLPQGMVNLTAAAAGYRLLPGGEHFSPAAELRVAYDPDLIPAGYTPDDIHTSYYDSAQLAWVRLERIGVDTASHEIVSLTTHFTDFINELLKAPEMPETQAFVPTAMSSLEAANPMEGLTLMQPPSPSQSGTAELNYSFDIPAGRNGMQPNLALTYNSGGGGGWLGEGWDIPIPTITIETRWGVPRYDENKESEVYLYKGEQLVTKNDDGNFRQMPHRTSLWCDRLSDGTQFYPRVNEAFDSIVRHGTVPSDYWWEVYDRAGVVYRYGHYETLDNDTNQSTLRDNRGNIAKWCLTETEDAYGNMVRYLYDTVLYTGIEGSVIKGRQIYPAEIHYTLHRDINGFVDDTGYHRIIFWREDDDRTRKHSHKVFSVLDNGQFDLPQNIPPTINCRNGFKEVSASLLSYLRIYSGDTLNRIYHFGMRIDHSTNYKVVLKNVCSSARQGVEDYSEKGVYYRGYNVGNWLNFDYVTADNELFGPEVIMDNEWSGRGYAFDVNNIGFVGGATSVLGRSLSTSALSMSKGFNYSVGGGISVGLGCNVFWTELAAGGNYSYSHSSDKGFLTLIDLDGDGLADKVFKDIVGRVCYRKHIRMDDGKFIYGPVHVIQGIDDFQTTTGHSHDVGLQVSIGISATGSRNWGKSYTTTYFSDVNADGLPDLVTDKGVYFNDLVDGIPTFSRTPYHTNPDIVDTVRTSTMPCGYIIYDGELNDSIYCTTKRVERRRSYRDPHALDSGIVVDFFDCGFVVSSINGNTVQGYRDTLDCTSRSYRTGGADGIGGWGIDPAMEAVKVWVAQNSGTVTVTDSIRVMPDRSGSLERSRYSDGMAYSVQLCRGVLPLADTGLTCTSQTLIHALSGQLSSADTFFVVNDTTFTVSPGDIVFFRIQSGQSRLFDRADWRHNIVYNNIAPNLDVYGKPANKYISKEDFVVEGKDFFQAPSDGYLLLDISVKTGALQNSTGHSNITVHIRKNNETPQGYSVTENHSEVINVALNGSIYNYLSKGDSIKVWITAEHLNTTWGNVECIPHYRFVPVAKDDVADSLSLWIAPSIPVLNQIYCTAYGNLFGPLYRGWGQFCYMADGTPLGDLIDLQTLRCSKVASANSLDSNNMKGIGNRIDTDNMTFDDFSSAVSASGNYNPLSATDSRWRLMEADCRNQAWLGYGRTTVITRTMAANVCPKEFFAKGESVDIMDMDCPATAPTVEYPKVKTHARYSESRTDNYSFSAEIGALSLGTSRSNGFSNTLTDFMDLNGDRYPDLIGEGAVQLTMPYGGLENNTRAILGKISENGTTSGGANVAPGSNPQKTQKMFGKTSSGAKIESVPTMPPSRSGSGGAVTGIDTARFALADINGDGLPDKVYADGNVSLNIGYMFLTPEPWNCGGTHRGQYISGSGSASVSSSMKPPFNIAKFSIGGGRSIGLSDNETEFQLMDINGDGLPDRVERNNQNNLTVHINLGGGRWEKIIVGIDRISHGISFNESVNASVTAGGTIVFAKVTGTVSGTPLGRNFSGDKAQFTDVDGDGFPDYVTSSAEDRMTVRYNRLGRVNQLVGVHNFNDATFTMDYSFVPPTYNQPQGQWVLSECRVIGDAAKGIPDSYTTYEYRNPHYDRFERTSFGFDTVITCQYTLNTSGEYIPYRYVTEGYHNNSYQMRSKKRSESISDADRHRWDETLYDITVVDVESGDTVGSSECPLVSYPLIEKTVTNHYEGQASSQLTTAKSLIYDSYRNVKTYINWGDTNRTGDELRADIGYVTGRPRNQVSLRNSAMVYEGRQTSAPLMRKSLFTYNSNGSLASRTDFIDNTQTATTDFTHDVYGNTSMITLPENASGQRMWYSYTYDPVLHRLPVQTSDAYGRNSYATYRYTFGKPLSVTDVAGNTIRYTYDSLGRTLAVLAPDEAANNAPFTWKADYWSGHLSQTSHYDKMHPGNPIETITLCDAWGRIIQVRKDAVINGVDSMQVSGRIEYDALGRTVRQYDPTACDFDSLVLYRRRPSVLRTVTNYDLLDRAVQCSTYHNGTPLIQTTAYAYVSSATGTVMQTTATDPLGRTTISIADAHGRTLSVSDALGGTTSYAYDALGQLLQTTDPDGFPTSYTYDLLGRTIQRIHPDAGITTNDYDPVGNVVAQTNAEGETVATSYHFLRPTLRHYSENPQNDVSYTYNPAGQISEIQDGSGRQTLFYDALGNVSKNIRTFAVPFSNNTYTFTMDYEYDSWGRMLEMTYPDGEVVTYSYDHGGNLSDMSGAKNGDTYRYVNRILYDRFGSRNSIEYGNQSRSEYQYDDLKRLVRLKTFAHNAGNETLVQDVVYSFDNVGNITDATNSAAAFGSLGGNYANHYEYDYIDRLVFSSQSYGTGNTLDMVYSPSGRVCNREQLYTSQNEVFGYNENDKPHAPRRIYNNTSGVLYDLLWDEQGNLARISTTNSEHNTIETCRHLFWTEDNRLTNVVDDKYFSYYAYDHSGERVLKMTGKNTTLDINAEIASYHAVIDKTTLYTSPYLVADNYGYTKHYYAGTERVCARLGNGGLNRLGDFAFVDFPLSNRSQTLFNKCINLMAVRDLKTNYTDEISSVCDETPVELLSELEEIPSRVTVATKSNPNDFINAMSLYSSTTQQSEVPYFYHSDHLGSASWITDASGIPVQHLQYLPFGESFINQRATGSSYNERFTFTGKEKDSETGFYYFGARYYDPSLSGLFISIDPMSDKYPNISPYAYCAWNPVKLVDPDGEESEEPPAKWDNIDPVIKKSLFVGWGKSPYYNTIKDRKGNNEEPNCNDYAKMQLEVVGCCTTEGNNQRNIYTYDERRGVNVEGTYKAINYIQDQLKQGNPVFAGVDEQYDKGINNLTTDHFIVIVGQGNDNKGNFFLFYDNGTGSCDKGTSDQNKLYYNKHTKEISGYSYGRKTRLYYILSEIRPTKKIKK